MAAHWWCVSNLQGCGNTYSRVVLVAKSASPVLRVPPGLSLANLAAVLPATMGGAAYNHVWWRPENAKPRVVGQGGNSVGESCRAERGPVCAWTYL